MDQQNQFQAPNQMNSTWPPAQQSNPNPIMNNLPDNKPRKFGLIIIIALIIVIIIALAIYLFSSKMNSNSALQSNTDTEVTTPVITQDQNNDTAKDIAPISNTNDDIDSLQQDLNMSIDGIETQSI